MPAPGSIPIEPMRDEAGNVLPSETWICGLCDPPLRIEGRDAFFDHAEEAHADLLIETPTGRGIQAKSGVVGHSDYPDRVVWYTQWHLFDGRRIADSYQIKPRVDDGPWHDG
jgi:hypothetical protein